MSAALQIADYEYLLDEDEVEQLEAELREAYKVADEAGIDPGGDVMAWEPTEETDAEDWQPSPDDEARADYYLRAVRARRREVRRVEAAYKVELERLTAWRSRLLREPRRALSYLERMLELFSEAVGRKRRVSAHGTLSWTTPGKSVVIAGDEDDWCRAQLPPALAKALEDYRDLPACEHIVTIELKASRATVKTNLKRTGELPNGTELVTGQAQFKIDVED